MQLFHVTYTISYFLTIKNRAREALRQCLPDQLKDNTFANCLKEDKSTKHWLSQLLKNLESAPVSDERLGYQMT